MMRTLLAEPFPPGSCAPVANRKLQLGFIGFKATDLHWLDVIHRSGLAGRMAAAECSREFTEIILRIQPDSLVLDSWVALLEVELDGVLIATPGAGQAEQAVTALERGMASA